jgi:hypothetical protein
MEPGLKSGWAWRSAVEASSSSNLQLLLLMCPATPFGQAFGPGEPPQPPKQEETGGQADQLLLLLQMSLCNVASADISVEHLMSRDLDGHGDQLQSTCDV